MEHLINNIYREYKPGSTCRYNYFIYRQCDRCHNWYYAKKYGKKYTLFCSSKCAGSTRGRPIGSVLSDEVKKKIAVKRSTQKHTPETKAAIRSSIKSIDFSKLPPRKYYKVSDEHKKLRNSWRNHRWFKILCNEWLDFNVFKKWVIEHGWRPGLTVSRKNTDFPFGPGNTHIITRSQHCINRLGRRKK